jgi:hypothetical protein
LALAKTPIGRLAFPAAACYLLSSHAALAMFSRTT